MLVVFSWRFHTGLKILHKTLRSCEEKRIREKYQLSKNFLEKNKQAKITIMNKETLFLKRKITLLRFQMISDSGNQCPHGLYEVDNTITRKTE